MSDKLRYGYDELMAERAYASRLGRGDVLFHGGLDGDGRYIPPRSLHRLDAIRAWRERLESEGYPSRVVEREQLALEHFPNAPQAKLLLRHGAKGAMTRILTMIGIVEGFGNAGIRAMPRPELQPLFADPIEGTCLDHLYTGLLEAHGNDEAGRAGEAGHDGMWYAIRDAALEDPEITPDMYENLPFIPPPGYEGRAEPSPDAMRAAHGGGYEPLFPDLDRGFEILLSGLAQLLLIEHGAYATFAWAQEVLSDPAGSASPEWAPFIVSCIQEDEGIHVDQLDCVLAEVACRTLLDRSGKPVAGREVVDAVLERALERQQGSARQRQNAHRMQEIRDELAARTDGEAILAEFAAVGPVPEPPRA
ncbi:MAG: hypothetical protein ACE5FL_07295 [Myxococcota bacterium]